MTFTQTSDLPSLDISPVHAQITIFLNGGEYIAYVITDMGASAVPIRLKPHDVKNLNILLQEAIQRIASGSGSGTSHEVALEELARIGNYAFQRVFSDVSSREVIRNALSVGKMVQIVSKEFFIPWELLYDGPLDAETHISYYWGMKHIISRTIIQDMRRGAQAPSTIESKRPKVGLITSDRLPFVAKQELPMLRKLHQSRSIQLSLLRELTSIQRPTDLAELGRFLGQDLQILHFACHAYEQDPLEQSYLFITKDFALSMIDFVVGQYELKHNPFVILNACLTSVINPLYTSSWAEKLWECGARGVLATDFHVPDWFAASFSEMLYQHLLSGTPIGEALFTIRHQFWMEKHNLLGLAYALYSSPSIKISRSKEKGVNIVKKTEKETLAIEGKTTDEEEILVITSDPAALGTRGGGPQPLKIEELVVNVNVFIQQMGKVLESAPEKVGKFRFDEFEIHAEITADGTLALLGSGVHAGASAGLHFTFRRSSISEKE